MGVDPTRLTQRIQAGDRAAVGRALTLVESRLPSDRRLAEDLLAQLPAGGETTLRIGLSGVPGAGKSTLIDVLGPRYTAAGHRVAVLAVDPSSSMSGGSILADKTRMPTLAVDPAAFIRPSPSGGSLGGVASRTREAMLVLEAAGYDRLIVETVGVGQSEAAVARMVDCFVLLLLAGAGDELQGIKRGVLELADLVAINKADGAGAERARQAAAELASALGITHGASTAGVPPVLAISAATAHGVDRLSEAIERHRRRAAESGARSERRRRQRLSWWNELVQEGLAEAMARHAGVAERRQALEAAVLDGRTPPSVAARALLEAFGVAAPASEDVG